MRQNDLQLWLDASGPSPRWFLIPPGYLPLFGKLRIRNLQGDVFDVDPAALIRFEVPEDRAMRFAYAALGETLQEVRATIDRRLTRVRKALDERNPIPFAAHASVTNDVGPALLDLFKSLPRVIGNSLTGEAQRVESARVTMHRLQQRLGRAGISVDRRFTSFPDRLADLRAEFDERRNPK